MGPAGEDQSTPGCGKRRRVSCTDPSLFLFPQRSSSHHVPAGCRRSDQCELTIRLQVSDQSDSWLPSVNGEEGSSEICSPLTPQEGVMAPPCPLECRGGPVSFQWLHRTYWTKLPHSDWLWHWGCVGGEGGVETFEDHQPGCIAGCDFPLPLGYLPL